MRTGNSIKPFFYREGIVVPEFVEDNLFFTIREAPWFEDIGIYFTFDLWRFVARYKRFMGVY